MLSLYEVVSIVCLISIMGAAWMLVGAVRVVAHHLERIAQQRP